MISDLFSSDMLFTLWVISATSFEYFFIFDIVCPSFHFQQWCALGALDLDQFVEDNLKDLSDWEKNFKGLKARGRDAEKLPRYGHCYGAWLMLS